MEYTYNWLHIPTGKTGTHSTDEEDVLRLFGHLFTNQINFYLILNLWNKSSEDWKYWM